MRIDAPLPKAFGALHAMTAAREFRELLFDEQTNVFRLVSGAADGFPDVVVDSYAGKLLVQWLSEEAAQRWGGEWGEGFEQFITKQKRTKPQPIPTIRRRRGVKTDLEAANEDSCLPAGTVAAKERFLVREHGLNFLASFGDGFSTGIFPDQRENRRRLLSMNLAGKTVLNCFAYTCAFSVAAANAGATVTSLDLSKSYLEWGKENFRVNQLNPDAHDFIYGDVFSWLKRFGKRGRRWDVVLLDPPTFSTTKKGRVFRAAKDYRELAELAVPLVTRDGWLFCSTNQRTLRPDTFERTLRDAAQTCGRRTLSLDYETQPFDFRVAGGEELYLKTFWMRLG
jgi:23S rRNA (cytosine1962-C5)-methyltransferase